MSLKTFWDTWCLGMKYFKRWKRENIGKMLRRCVLTNLSARRLHYPAQPSAEIRELVLPVCIPRKDGIYIDTEPWWRKACYVSSSPPRQNGPHFADDIFSCIFVNKKFCISIKISLKFVSKSIMETRWRFLYQYVRSHALPMIVADQLCRCNAVTILRGVC